MLGGAELIAIFFVFGSAAVTIVKVVGIVADKAFGGKQKQSATEAREAQDRARALESQLLDARLQNDHLQKQLEWHTKMLETQDRMMKQLTDGSTTPHSDRPTPSRS